MVKDSTIRLLQACVLVILALQLSACIEEDEDENDGDVGAATNGSLSLAFTNPAGTSEIATPDIVVNISGTASSIDGVETVTWQNDRGGKGNANGKENWVTGNIVLQLGENNITITATDSSGVTVSKGLTVQRENTAPSAVTTSNSVSTLMYSYDASLQDSAPVEDAQIRPGATYLFVQPSDEWLSKGIRSIRIACCKGQSGPGQGEDFDQRVDVYNPTWSHRFDMAGFQPGGVRRVRVKATFNDGSTSDVSSYDFTVQGTSSDSNTAPIISGTPNPNATVGVQYSFRPSAQDPDGDTMRFSVSNKPAWASFNSTTGRLFGTPSAGHVGRHRDITISVSDGKTSSSLPAFSIDVEAVSNGSANLTWTIPTRRTDNAPLDNLDGFNIYYGQTPGDYANKIKVNNSTVSNYLVDNLSAGQWFFVITAVDTDGLESNPSNRGSKSF